MLWVCHMNKINNVPFTVLLSKLNERACKITQSRTLHMIDIQLMLFPPFFALVLLKVLNQEHFLPTAALGGWKPVVPKLVSTLESLGEL